MALTLEDYRIKAAAKFIRSDELPTNTEVMFVNHIDEDPLEVLLTVGPVRDDSAYHYDSTVVADDFTLIQLFDEDLEATGVHLNVEELEILTEHLLARLRTIKNLTPVS